MRMKESVIILIALGSLGGRVVDASQYDIIDNSQILDEHKLRLDYTESLEIGKDLIDTTDSVEKGINWILAQSDFDVGILWVLGKLGQNTDRSEEHTSELQSHSFISYAVFCLQKKPPPPSPSLSYHHSTGLTVPSILYPP